MRRKNLPIAIVLGLTPFGLMYVGGWRVLVTWSVAWLIFQVILTPLNWDTAGLPNIPLIVVLTLLSIVYLLNTLLHRETYNKAIEAGDDPKEFRSFKQAWLITVTTFHGMILVYLGAVLFWIDLARSGEITIWSVTKGTFVTGAFIYFLNKGLTWASLAIKRRLLTEKELAEYPRIRDLIPLH